MEYIDIYLSTSNSLPIESKDFDLHVNFEDPQLKKFIEITKSRHVKINEEIKKHFILDQSSSNESVL